MKIFILSDLHGDLSYLRSCASRIQSSDMVVLCGDLTHFGHAKEACEILDEVAVYTDTILGVIGNCDNPGVAEELSRRGYNLHSGSRVVQGIAFIGVEGSLVGPGSTPTTYAESDFHLFLQSAMASLDEHKASEYYGLVLVCHGPPYGGKTDRVMKVKHIGSRALREFVERETPLACFAGHAHEAAGIETIGNTTVVNPGAFRQGNYAVAEITADPETGGDRIQVSLETADRWKR